MEQKQNECKYMMMYLFLKYNLTYFKLMIVFRQLYNFNVRKQQQHYVHGLDIYRWFESWTWPWLRCCPTWGASKSHSKRRCSKRVLVWRLSFFFLSQTVFLSIVILLSLSRLEVLMWAVRQTVPSQVTVAPKHLSAAATAVGLDVCMGEKVSFQVTSLIKGSSACGAFVGRLLFRFKASKGLFPLIV